MALLARFKTSRIEYELIIGSLLLLFFEGTQRGLGILHAGEDVLRIVLACLHVVLSCWFPPRVASCVDYAWNLLCCILFDDYFWGSGSVITGIAVEGVVLWYGLYLLVIWIYKWSIFLLFELSGIHLRWTPWPVWWQWCRHRNFADMTLPTSFHLMGWPCSSRKHWTDLPWRCRRLPAISSAL